MGRKPLDQETKIANRKATQKENFANWSKKNQEKIKLKKASEVQIDAITKETKSKFVIAKKEAGLTADEFLNLLLDKDN